MSRVHNKKRNVGLMYEFLIRYMSESLVENNDRESKKALKILKKHFKPSSELYREFRLFNSLIKTTVSSDRIAAAIISEARKAVRRYDSKSLDKQKSLLIRDINHLLSNDDFYNQKISEYRMYATVQTLINEWRNIENADISKIAEYEDALVEWLTSKKETVILEDQVDKKNDQLVVDIMFKKLNEKYSKSFCDEQKSLIRSYVFSLTSNENKNLLRTVNTIKEKCLNSIDLLSENSDFKNLQNKMTIAREKIQVLNFQEINDRSISKCLEMISLKNEILNKDDEK
tara:strand:- start:345 stop:1202 length:858 start_codon:yes stop_codon:yes gene_type:complete